MIKLPACLLGLALTSALAFAANGADLYRDGPGGYKDGYYPVATWTGFYAGVNAGGGWSQDNGQLGILQPSGGFGGVQLGYNWQGLGYSPLVLGVEADAQASAIEDEKAIDPDISSKSRLQFFGTVRGRIGYAMDRSLLYFTGGLAFGTLKDEAVNGVGDFLINTTTIGYVLGGGLEYRINPSLSVKGEYQYLNLGKNDPTDPAVLQPAASANGVTVRDDAFHTFRVGLNYRPFPAYAPLK